jgi:excisionase family DNA binding protein
MGKAPKTDKYDELLSSREVTRRLSIAYSTLRKKVNNGEIPSVRCGRNFRFRRGDIEQYIGGVLPSQQAPELVARPEPDPDPVPAASEEPLDDRTWLQRYEAAGRPESLPLDLFLTVPDAAFDLSGEMLPQFRTAGPVAAVIVRNAPRSFLVSVCCAGKWEDVDDAANTTDARWLACDALWATIHDKPHAVTEAFVEDLCRASVRMHRLHVVEDAQLWRDKCNEAEEGFEDDSAG